MMHLLAVMLTIHLTSKTLVCKSWPCTQMGQVGQNIKPLKVDYRNHLYVRAFNTLFSGTGKLYNDEGLSLDRYQYSHGNTLYAFDLSPDLTDDDHFDLIKTGSVRIQAKFSEALAEPVTLIVYTEHQNLLEIDRNRNMTFDFS